MVGTPLRLKPVTRPRPALRLGALVLAGAVALVGCGGDDEPKAEAPDPQETAAGATLSGEWPLTGLPAEGKAPAHPVVVVKIDNTAPSSPQVGLGGADLVAEELVEGGSTRLAVFYYSQTPKRVGPVRSLRASDIGIVRPAEAVMVASGGAPGTMNRVKRAGIKVVTEGGKGFSRDSSRRSPYNLFMDLPALTRSLKAPSAPPQSYFGWGEKDGLPAGQPARTIAAKFSGGHTTRWEFRKGTYVNLNSNAAKGDEFKPSTVLVLRVKVGVANYKDPAGNPVPEMNFAGSGEAMVFHNGSLVRGTWTKPKADSAVSLKTKAGELRLPPGKVWLELVPANGGDVTFGK